MHPPRVQNPNPFISLKYTIEDHQFYQKQKKKKKRWMDTRSKSMRVVMFPWLAHGHISPFLELAKSLAKRNFVTYICSSQINLDFIKADLSPKDSISIKLVELHIAATPELPPPLHTTNGLPPHLMAPLKRALDQARPSFSTLLTTLKPDLLLYDFLQPWAPEAAPNIPAVLFYPAGAAAFSLLAHHWFGNPSDHYPFPAIYFRENEHSLFDRLVNSAGTDTADHLRVQDCIRRSSEIVLIKTFREIEGKYVHLLSELTRKKFVPVGPLVQEIGQTAEKKENEEMIMEWLDRRDRRSTVFASFGSEYFLSESEVEEIAHGLEMSGVSFLWVVRFPAGERRTVGEKLPEGFLERVGERGMVVEGWAPQRRILSRPSVGGFMSHCGWSSVMEGAYCGVPIIAVPMHLDQPLNARLVEEVGIGEEVVRLEREEVARVVRKVVVERSGEGVRRRAAEMGERMREKGEAEVDGVVEEVVRLCRKDRFNLDSENSMERLDVMAEENTQRMLSENT
ncbi:UDP-glucosyltransferase 29-like [Salvia miltiorrhiza]|uniref:UDP-glucosyltransferase 29-like n=1 Tax=Salvia miltiorrhiza TaxID=226208 RepID=UPI0025AD00A4|nr:UDP-glucosyltransferase 29-like [Salvia miltiorrhiza]